MSHTVRNKSLITPGTRVVCQTLHGVARPENSGSARSLLCLFSGFQNSAIIHGPVGILVDALFDFRTEIADQSLNRPCSRVAERADRVALDLLGHLLQHVDLADLGVADGHKAIPLRDESPGGEVSLREERRLSASEFGAEYIAYKDTVGRFTPKLRGQKVDASTTNR